MNSRLGTFENIRAAELTYVPGDAKPDLIVPDDRFGDGRWVVYANPFFRRDAAGAFAASPSGKIYREYETVAHRIEPVAKVPTFEGVRDVDPAFMDQRVVSKRKSYLPEEEFDKFGSETYPDPPVLWQTTIGDPGRFFGR